MFLCVWKNSLVIRSGLGLLDVSEKGIMIEHRPRENAASENAGEVCVNPNGKRDGMV